jgi:membrane protease YdiL (CAAX protease family)
MSPRAFWSRIAVTTAAAETLGFAVSPPRPPAQTPPVASVALGAVAGTLLFAALLRRRPVLAQLVSGPSAVGRNLFFALCAANEEVLWRRVLLGELLPLGGLAALAASSAGFSVAHRRARPLHVVTGATFGTLYLATGALAACIAAHWAYNALVGSLAKRAPP